MQKSKFFLVAMILTLGIIVFPTSAQEEFEPCGQVNIDSTITALTRELEKAQAASSPEESIDILAAISSRVIVLQSYCNKWAFSEVGPAVLGPINLPKGTYTAMAYVFGDEPFEATITALEGNCHEGMANTDSKTLFSLEGKVANAQAIIDSSECRASISINSKGHWQLLITRLDPSQLVTSTS